MNGSEWVAAVVAAMSDFAELYAAALSLLLGLGITEWVMLVITRSVREHDESTDYYE